MLLHPFAGDQDMVLTGQPQRWYTPNIVAPGDTQSPARDTTTAQMQALFANEVTARTILQGVDVWGFFPATIRSADADTIAMFGRAVPLLKKYGIAISAELGGPLGYAPAVSYGGLTPTQMGQNSADFNLSTSFYGTGGDFQKIEAYGGTVAYVALDSPLRRVVSNGLHKAAHKAFRTVGTAAANNGVTYTAVTAGSAGNSIRIEHISAVGPSQPISVTVSGNDITVHLATDTGGNPTVSTASAVKTAVDGFGPAAALVTTALAGSGVGISPTFAIANLQYGDDGVNLTYQNACVALVEYMKRILASRPTVKFLHMESTILWPYNGVAGYDSNTYPANQMPDFKTTFTELMSQLTAAGTSVAASYTGLVMDHSYEYPEKLVTSINSNADDWYARMFATKDQVEAAGKKFGYHANSLCMSPANDASHSGPDASEDTFADQVQKYIRKVETYRRDTATIKTWPQIFKFDCFGYYPRTITPFTTHPGTDDLYLLARTIFERERR